MFTNGGVVDETFFSEMPFFPSKMDSVFENVLGLLFKKFKL